MDLVKSELAKYDEVSEMVKNQLPDVNNYIINGVWDENGYEAAKRAHREVRKIVNAIDNRRKEIKAPILDAGRAVDARAKELIDICKPVENELMRRISSVDMEREAIKQANRKKREAELIEAGYEYSLGAYRVGDQVVAPVAIDEAEDDEWKGIIDRGIKASERVRAEQEQRKKELEELEELRKLKAEMEKSAAQNNIEPTVDINNTLAAGSKKDPYQAGFDACKTLCVEIVKSNSSRRVILSEIENLSA